MTGQKKDENDPNMIVGREDVEIDPQPHAEDDGEGRGHPLPSSEKARHGSIPENIERTHGHGAN